MAVHLRSPLFICSEAYELLVDIAIIAKRELQDIYEDQLLLSAAWDFLIKSANSSITSVSDLTSEAALVGDLGKPFCSRFDSSVHMARSGSQGFVRGRTAFVSPRAQSEDLTTGGEKFRLKDEHYHMMVSYLEVPENFAAITGGWKKTKVGAKHQKRAVVMKQFHVAISEFGFPKDISIPNFTKRYQRYVARYKEAQLWRVQTGRGLTEEEIANGVTIDEKLNKLCPHFHRMDEIFGARPNVAPEIEADVGVNDADYVYPQGATNQC
ncbi:unnamed protein product [Calypogeia fissa]